MFTDQLARLTKDFQLGAIPYTQLRQAQERYGTVDVLGTQEISFHLDHSTASVVEQCFFSHGYSPKAESTATGVLLRLTVQDLALQRGLSIYSKIADSGDVLLARKDLKMGFWDILSPEIMGNLLTSLEEMDAVADGSCQECERAHHRRWAYICRSVSGKLYCLGTNCGASIFGVDMAALWKQEMQALKKQKKLRREFFRVVDVAVQQQWSIKALTDLGFPHEKVLEYFRVQVQDAANAQNSFIYNTWEVLLNKPWMLLEDGERLSRWGAAALRTYQKSLEPAAPKVEAVKPSTAKGDRGTFQFRVTKINVRQGFYGNEKCWSGVDETGWKFWFRSWNSSLDDVQVGATIRLSARVSEHKEGITFLSHPTKVQVLSA